MPPIADLADSWSSIYSDSAAIKSAVGFAHVGGLLAGGGMAIAADRATLAAHRSASTPCAAKPIALAASTASCSPASRSS